MTLLFLAICLVGTNPGIPTDSIDSIICEIYDAEVELIGAEIKNIEVASPTGEDNLFQMEKEKGKIKLLIGKRPEVVVLHYFSGSFDNTKRPPISQKIKIKIPKGIKIVVDECRNSDCRFIEIAGEVCLSRLLWSDISFTSSASSIKISRANSSSITVDQNIGSISLEKLIATTVMIKNNEGDLILKEGILGRTVRGNKDNVITIEDKALKLLNCRGNWTIHSLHGDLEIRECTGYLQVASLIGKIFLLKNGRVEKFQGILKNVEIQLE